MSLIDLPYGRETHLPDRADRRSRYGDQPTLAMRMLLDIRDGKTVSWNSLGSLMAGLPSVLP